MALLMDLLIEAPQFVWEAMANFVAVLAAGLIIAFATSYIYRKKDERTCVAGVILEKRIDASTKFYSLLKHMHKSLKLGNLIQLACES